MPRRPKKRSSPAQAPRKTQPEADAPGGGFLGIQLKRLVFGIVTVFLSVSVSMLALELALRRQVEGSWSAVFGNLAFGGVPYSNPSTDQWVIADPHLGYRLNPDHPDNNSLGLRNPEIGIKKTAGTKRILVLGDSVAAGADSFVTILRQRLKDRAQVINGAVPGYTIYQERLYLERDLLRLEPDLVVLQYCANDNHKFLHRLDPEGQFLITEEARRALLPDQRDPLSWLPGNSYLAFRLRFVLLKRRTGQESGYPWDRMPDLATAWRDESWDEYGRQFLAIHKMVKNSGSALAVVVAPLAAQFDPGMLRHDPRYVLKPQSKLAAICRQVQVPMLDLHPVFYKHQGWTLYRGDGIHFNETGHQVTADALMDFLESNRLIPTN